MSGLWFIGPDGEQHPIAPDASGREWETVRADELEVGDTLRLRLSSVVAIEGTRTVNGQKVVVLRVRPDDGDRLEITWMPRAAAKLERMRRR